MIHTIAIFSNIRKTVKLTKLPKEPIPERVDVLTCIPAFSNHELYSTIFIKSPLDLKRGNLLVQQNDTFKCCPKSNKCCTKTNIERFE